VLIRDRLGNDVFGTNTFHLGVDTGAGAAGDRLAVTFAIRSRSAERLGPSPPTAAAPASASFDWWDRAAVFEIIPGAAPSSSAPHQA
jgi:lipopolysaccharide transport system ATP-binding protein